MAIIPQTNRADAQRRQQIPEVHTFLASPAAFGSDIGTALARAGSALGDALIDWKSRRTADQADAALTRYQADMSAALYGTTDADGTATPGLTGRRLHAAEGSARDFAAAEKSWYENPDGEYSKLTPNARRLFEKRAAQLSVRYRQQAVDHELAETRAAKSEDWNTAADVKTSAYDKAIDSPDADAFRAEAAAYYADAKVGPDRVRRNPDGTRAFADKAAQDAWTTLNAERDAELLKRQADHILSKADAAPADPAMDEAHAARVATARAIAEKLPSDLADNVRESAVRSETVRSTRKESSAHAARIAVTRAEKAADDALAARWQQALTAPGGSGFDDALIRDLAKSPNVKKANEYIEQARRYQAAIANADAKQADTSRSLAADAAARETIAALSLGYTKADDGRISYMAHEERRTIAMSKFLDGTLSKSQHDGVMAAIAEDDDARSRQLTETIVRNVIPRFADALEEDKSTGRIAIDPDEDSKGRPRFTRETPVGIDREYTRTDTRRNKTVRERQKVLLGHVADELNAVRQLYRVTPGMTHDQAVAKFTEAIAAPSAEYDRLTVEESIARQQSLATSLEARWRKAAVSTPAQPSAAAKRSPAQDETEK